MIIVRSSFYIFGFLLSEDVARLDLLHYLLSDLVSAILHDLILDLTYMSLGASTHLQDTLMSCCRLRIDWILTLTVDTWIYLVLRLVSKFFLSILIQLFTVLKVLVAFKEELVIIWLALSPWGKSIWVT